MPAILLYLAVTLAILFLWDRFVQRLTLAAAITLVLLPLCFTGRALLSGRIYAPVDLPYMSEPLKEFAPDVGITPVHNGTLSDLYCQIIPWQHAVRHSLGQGDWPVWNPFLLCGTVLAANMQAAPYDPVHLLGLLLSHPQALTFGAAMTFFLAGFFTFAFARSIGLGEIAALCAAAGYMFNAMLAFFIAWPLGRAWAFLPLVLFAVRGVVRASGASSVLLLTLSLVLTIFAGHPETTLHVVAIGAAYGLFEVIVHRTPKAIAYAAVAGVLALFITAISLLPFLSAAPETIEYDVRHNFYKTSKFYTSAEIIGLRAGRTFFPFFGGQPERGNVTALWDPSAPRTGSIIVALSLAALIVARRKDTWFFFGLAIVALCTAFDAPPFAHLLHELPLFDIALNQRLAFAGAFALSILAAIGGQAILPVPTESRQAGLPVLHRTAVAIILATGVALAVIASLIWNQQTTAGVDPELIRALLIVELAPLAILALLLAFRTPARYALPALLGLILLQRTLADGDIYPTLPRAAFYPEVPVLREIKKDAKTPFRIVGLNYAMIPDTAAMYGLEDVRGYEAMTFKRIAETFPLWSIPQPVSFNVVENLDKPFLSFLNVRYAITRSDEQAPDGWRLVLQDRGSRLYENTRALPRAFVPRRVRYERSSVDVILGMGKANDFADMAWITVPHYKPHEISNGPGQLTLRKSDYGYEIDAVMDLDGWVVVSDSKWPGWRAYIDGRRVETHYANHAFLGVFVPKGTHHLRLIYKPEAFTRGRNITFATLVLLGAFFALRHRLQKPRAV